jgi:prolyl oligopeptidase
MSSPSQSLVPSGSAIFAISSMIFLSLRKACYRRNVNVVTLISQICSSSAATKEKVLDKISSDESLTSYWESRDGENVFLEDVLGNEALQWVKDKNQKCVASLGNPEEDPLYAPVLSILESKDKIPHLRKIGSQYYNFWTDENHVRGIWRRISSLEDYTSADCEWETVLDLDELGKKEGESWVYKGHTLNDLEVHTGIAPTKTLLNLSKGGADATVIREFDLETKSFVDPDTDHGFFVPEAKSRASWLSMNELLIGTDFDGTGESLTDSGYPRVIRTWKRGTPLQDSVEVYAGEKSDVSVSDHLTVHGGHSFEWRSRSLTFYTSKTAVRMGSEEQWHELEVLQEDAETDQFLNQMLISLRSDWKISSSVTYRSGSLLVVDILDFVYNGLQAHSLKAIFEPSADNRVSLDSYVLLRTRVVLHLLDNVKSKLSFWEFDETKGEWLFQDSETEPVIRGASLRAIDSDTSDECWFTTSTFLNPSQLSILDASLGAAGVEGAVQTPLKSLPAQFDAEGFVEEQGQAVSEDGTVVPFFILRAKNIKYDGSNPTLLYGYGGFEISLLPSYAAITGTTWLKSGGVYVR